MDKIDNIETLRNIAEYLGFDNIVSELEAIDMRSKQENASLILPLVGEFSSGKTTLINALTDSKKLETATKPTTATIYEVHFGCDSCHAKVVDEKGELHSVQDIADLKNSTLADAKVVTVFDTSNRVPSTTILVDTPGLSSPDPKHKQTLVNFLPKADGIMLVTDINQQITRSLTDFIETMKLSKRPIYLILSKSDTKSESEIEAAKKYISDNCQIPLKQIAVVSASTGSLDELYSLLDSIQKDKKDILKKVSKIKLQNLKKRKVRITWKKVKNADGYQVYRATKKNGKYKLVKVVKGNKKVSYTNTKLKKNKKYYYKVRAYRTVKGKKVYGAFSSKKSILIKK